MNAITLSIVAPAYNEAGSMPKFLDSVKGVLDHMGISHEIIVVDDGSTDTTREVIADRAISSGGIIKGVFLSRNFGHQAAINAGIDAANGSAVVVMDADLQHPPETIAEMYRAYQAGYDLVLARRTANEQNTALRNGIGKLFYSLMNRFSDLHLEPNVADFALYGKPIISTLRQLPEKDRFMRGLVQWVGFKKTYIEYESRLRIHGASKYNMKKLVRLAISGFTSFSAFPLRLAFWMGLIAFCGSGIYGLYILGSVFLLDAHFPPGWASLILVTLFIGSIQLMISGVMGEYLYRMHNEIKGRPLYIVQKQIGFADAPKKSPYGITADL